MRIHCLMHAIFEAPGYFKQWADEGGHTFTSTHVYEGEALPSTEEYDLLLVMGGPQSPRQTEKYPYLKEEIELIQRSIAKDKYVIGVCLGAQLIGESLGATVEKSRFREVGVFPIQLTDAAAHDPHFKNIPLNFKSGHWHADMPGLPKGAEVLATSEGCARQIICFTPKVYGFQCHMEFNQACVKDLILHSPQDLLPGKFIQTKAEILDADYSEMNKHLKQFLDGFVEN